MAGTSTRGVLSCSWSALPSARAVPAAPAAAATPRVAADSLKSYLRAHGQAPIFGASCLLQVTAGAEVAGWYWMVVQGGQGDAWGGKLRGYVFGSFICLVSLRGDITLEYYQQTFNNQTTRTFDGVGWVAGGLGFCDADGWKSWETRWWDQPFCWTAGARLQIKYREGPGGPNGWNVSYHVEFE